MGDFDFVPSVLEKSRCQNSFYKDCCSAREAYHFWSAPDAVVFGLPGNPVSSFIQFELLIRPLIYNMMGHDWRPPISRLPMNEKY